MIRYEHTPPQGVRFHPLAELFPWIEGDALERLREDIRANGVREPIVFMGDAIIDGRNRYMCARDLGIEYPRREFGSLPTDGTDPVAFVLSQNLHRRHLTESQRAAVAAKIANMAHGGADRFSQEANLPLGEAPAVTVTQAAEMLSVSERSVRSARKVQQDGAPELAQAVEAGKVAVSAAAAVADLPREEQAAVVAAGPQAVREKAKEIRQAKAAPAAPVGPDPAPQAPPAADDPDAPERRKLARLTQEALIDEVIGLRASLREERARRKEAEVERDSLKADLAEFRSDDMGRALGNAQRQVKELKGRLGEIQAQLARETRRANAMEKARDAAIRRLEAQEIPLGPAA